MRNVNVCEGSERLKLTTTSMPTLQNHTSSTAFLPRKQLKAFQGSLKKDLPDLIQSLAHRIEKKGFSAPVFVWKDHDFVLDGHQRLKALEILALGGLMLPKDEVPVVYIAAENETEARERVAEYNSAFSLIDADFANEWFAQCDMEFLAFDHYVPEFSAPTSVEEDLVPNVPDTDVCVRKGDLFVLGDTHRLLCGDATNPTEVKTLMGDALADMIFTDPPYNVNYHGSGQNTSNTILNDKLSDETFFIFLDGAFACYGAFSKPEAGAYIFHSASTQMAFQTALEKNGFEIKTQLIWNKPSATLGWGDYRMKHEPFFYCGKVGAKTTFYGDRTHTSVIDPLEGKSDAELLSLIKTAQKAEKEGKVSIWTLRRENVGEYVHPTQKPVELVEYALKNSSRMNHIVADFFGGSGSTLMACEKCRRICYTMELDPKYVQTILMRYATYANGKKTIRCLNRDDFPYVCLYGNT